MTRVEETAINLTVGWLQNNGYESADDYLQTGGNLVELAEDLYHKETQGGAFFGKKQPRSYRSHDGAGITIVAR